jgi:hypothetical protein
MGVKTQKIGHGTKLIDKLKNIAFLTRFGKLYVYANKDAVDFYHKKGFIKTTINTTTADTIILWDDCDKFVPMCHTCPWFKQALLNRFNLPISTKEHPLA